MSQNTAMDRDESTIAAEYALGLLEGEELMSARGRNASDKGFANRVAWWNAWFAPWTDEMPGAEPGAHVWDAIAAQVNGQARGQVDAKLDAAGQPQGSASEAVSNVVLIDMERRVRRWQWTAAITSAAAALAVAVLITAPGAAPVVEDAPPPLAVADAPPLMASIPIGDTLRLGVTFLPTSDEMLVSAAGLTADGVHDHELWLVPADGGALQSLGVVVPGEERRVALPSEVAQNMGDGVQVLLTREPLGGKPENVDAGPVVAQGAFGQV